jgi:glycosyltransferase involved in cell wall biosynthesis
MRIAVDYRILVVGPKEVNRGMGRFTQQQLRAVLQVDSDNDYILLCDPRSDLDLILPEVRHAPNVFLKYPPAWSQGSGFLGSKATGLRLSAEFQDWMYREDFSLYHSTAPFLLWEPIHAHFDACPTVVTQYDLIPMIFPGRYLNGPFREPYLRVLGMLNGATRLLAISESARRDAAVYLGFPADRIDVAYPVANSIFRPVPEKQARQMLKRVLRTVRLPERFILTISAYHHSKNLQGLMAAFALLPPRIRLELPLVVCCNFNPGELEILKGIARRMGIGDDIVWTGLVPDEALAALYAAATVVVHPSRYEGFGLPVLEAMASGAPVITTTASSMPEVAGDACVLVDPDDYDGFAAAIRTVTSDEELMARMRRKSVARAAQITTENLARDTLASYARTFSDAGRAQTVFAHGLRVAPARPRVAVWTPFPPERSGIADYSLELVQELVKTCDVEVFVNDTCDPPAELLHRFKIHHQSAFDRRNEQSPFDVALYQMGNTHDHWPTYQAIQRHPGIVTFHDLSFSQVLYDRFQAADDQDGFLAELAEVEGPAAAAEFARFAELDAGAAGAARGAFLARHPMLGRMVASSPVQIVHTEKSRSLLSARYPEANVTVVPMGVRDPYSARPARRRWAARERLGYAEGTCVISSFGIIHQVKRLDACIHALVEVLRHKPDTELVIVGRVQDRNYDNVLLALARELGVQDHVRMVGHASQKEFDERMIACDVVVNLRVPTASHMSGSLIRSIAAGRPVVATDLPEWAAFPGDFCLRVPPAPDDVVPLGAHLTRLAMDPPLRERMSQAARSWFLENARITDMAAGYSELISAVAGMPRIHRQVRPEPEPVEALGAP